MNKVTVRKGIVKFFSVYAQCWQSLPASAVPDRDLAAMSEGERNRVIRAAEAEGEIIAAEAEGEVTCPDLVCGCCGGFMPPQRIWEKNRHYAGDCTGSIGRHDRCRAWENNFLWG